MTAFSAYALLRPGRLVDIRVCGAPAKGASFPELPLLYSRSCASQRFAIFGGLCYNGHVLNQLCASVLTRGSACLSQQISNKYVIAMSPSVSRQHRSLPPWLRRAWPASGEMASVREVLSELSLHTVCRSAQCPNQGECWQRGTATFMVLGDVCTRDCPFCGVSSGMPLPPDPKEPANIAEAVRRLELRHVVVTTVTRDDLPDGGAEYFVAVVAALRAQCPGVTVELLTSDFGGNMDAVAQVAGSGPEVFAHNIETVARLHKTLRDPRTSYARSLAVLRCARDTLDDAKHVKSGLMVGCGEREAEVEAALRDLLAAGCDAVTIGQYLKPAGNRFEVHEFITPEQFDRYRQLAHDLGFAFAMAGPFVRSSYQAEALLNTPRTA